MHITHLSLTQFRNYSRLELELSPGTTLLYGDNAQGKTNLLESIYYLATTRSPFADQDSQLTNWDAINEVDPVIVGRIRATVQSGAETYELETRLIHERKAKRQGEGLSFRREVLISHRKVRLMDILGKLRVVLFLPSDMQLITGSPAKRRRYLDITLCQIDPIYCRALSQYNKILEQRNALLRQISEGGARPDVLPVFSDKLVVLGSQIFHRRSAFLQHMAKFAHRIHYEQLANQNETIRLGYQPRLQNPRLVSREANGQTAVLDGEWLMDQSLELIQSTFHDSLNKALKIDLARGSTTVGPHRDDWFIDVNGRNLGQYGSRGQQRSALLGLKLAEIEWMRHQTDETPLLLLDEVVAELDEKRRSALLSTVLNSNQAILTATDPNMFTDGFLEKATCLRVVNGRVDTVQHIT